MKKIIKNIPRIYFYITLILILSWLFFIYPPTITYDSSHYIDYFRIISGFAPWSDWDAVRGPVYPFLLFYFVRLSGFSIFSLLTFQFMQFIIFLFGIRSFIYLFFPKFKNNLLVLSIFILFIFFNPLVFGYFHAVLTESLVLAITPWILISSFKKKYNYLLILFGVFLWFIKQPYAFLVIFVEIGQIFNSFYDKKIVNTIHSLTRIFLIVLLIFILNNYWSNFLLSKANSSLENRGTESLVVSSISFINGRSVFETVENTTRSLLGTINLTQSHFEGLASRATYNFNNFSPNENGSIGYRFLEKCNVIGSSSSVINTTFISHIEYCHLFVPMISKIFVILVPITNFLFTFSFIVVVLFSPAVFIKSINKVIRVCLITSNLYLWFFSFFYASIDRYVVPVYIYALFTSIWIVITLFNLLNGKSVAKKNSI